MLSGVTRPLATIIGLSSTRIGDERDLRNYVARTTAACVSLALLFDVLNQLVFFETWAVAVRSWLITIAVAIAIAVPVLALIARAHLELDRKNAELDLLSRTDPLTGLLNRRALLDCGAEPAEVLALVIVDIDRFKRVNDRHGHLVGDEVIRTVANIITRTLGDIGRVGRLGGEEFALLTSEDNGAQLAARVELLRDQIAVTPIVSGDQSVFVTISAGLAIRGSNQTFEQLYAAADRALYMAKAAGRNRIVLASELPADSVLSALPLPERGQLTRRG
jgi:diguanylate cyclase (GGDEF)-like protein